MSTDIVLPQLGEGVTEVTIARWLKHAGDPIKKGEPICEVETDKITTEICAEADGKLAAITMSEGAHAKIGEVMGRIEQSGEPRTKSQEARSEIGEMTSQVSNVMHHASRAETRSPNKGRISPVVSRMAAENGIDLSLIAGTGEGGRVTKQDVLNYLEKRKQAAAKPDVTEAIAETQAVTVPLEVTQPTPAKPAPESSDGVELQPLTPMRRRIAEHMAASVRTSPHVTTIWEVDFTNVIAHRAANKARCAKEGITLTPLAYVVQATVAALKAHPMVNSQWRDEGIALMREYNIGIAAAVEEGLLVPVIQHVDELSLKGIARRLGELAGKARGKQLASADMQAGTFTITNHGVAGSIAATPIIHQPQCAILGLGAIEKRVKVITGDAGDVMAIRPCAFVSLTFDHRILDGASADAFVASFKRTLEGPWSDSA
jgi:2-oxoglutarate dehydrogenase E2 component (dihydrolipoamide succinyltransferase)